MPPIIHFQEYPPCTTNLLLTFCLPPEEAWAKKIPQKPRLDLDVLRAEQKLSDDKKFETLVRAYENHPTEAALAALKNYVEEAASALGLDKNQIELLQTKVEDSVSVDDDPSSSLGKR